MESFCYQTDNLFLLLHEIYIFFYLKETFSGRINARSDLMFCRLLRDIPSGVLSGDGRRFEEGELILQEETQVYFSVRFQGEIQKLPSSSVVTVRVAEHAASPAVLAALQVYCPACSGKASTTMSMAVFVTSSK